MSCDLTKGIDLDCGYKVGGINALYLANRNDIDVISHITNPGSDDDKAIDDITMKVGKVFYKFEFADGTGSYTIDLQNNSGVRNWLHTVLLTVPKIDNQIALCLEEIGLSNVVAIVEGREKTITGSNPGDENIHYLLGEDRGLVATAITGGPGQSETDPAGFQITLAGTQTTTGRELVPDQGTYTSPGAIAQLLAAII